MVHVPLTLTVNNAAQALEVGLRAIADGHTEIDLGALSAVDSAAVATLLAWQRAAAARGRTLRLSNLPPSLRGLIELYGATGLLPVSA